MNWKHEIKQLKLEYLKQTAPGFFEASGGYSMIIKPYDDRTANGLTKCIEDYVTFTGGYANRINTTGIPRKVNGQVRWTKGNSNKGAADVRILINGISADVEVKIGDDIMSKAQEQERDRIIKAGGRYFIATDMPSFLNWYRTINKNK